MNNYLKSIFRAPWSNEVATPGQRIVVWLLLAFLTLATVAMCYSAITKGSAGIPDHDVWVTARLVLGYLYFGALLFHIARKGRAPAGWLPW